MDEIIDALLAFNPKSKREGIELYDELCLKFPDNEWLDWAHSHLSDIFLEVFHGFDEKERSLELNKVIFNNGLTSFSGGNFLSTTKTPEMCAYFKFILGKSAGCIITSLDKEVEDMDFWALSRIIVTHHAFGKEEGQITFDNFFDKRFVIDCKEYVF